LECGSLLPLSSRPACWPCPGAWDSDRRASSPEKSGSKLPHSRNDSQEKSQTSKSMKSALLRKLFRHADGVGMDLNRVLELPSVAARQGDGDRYIPPACLLKD